MAEPDKTVRFISKLAKLTQDRKIEWTSTAAPDSGSTAFMADIEGRRLRIYKFANELPNPDYAAYASPNSLTVSSVLSPRVEPPKTILASGTILEIFDDSGRVVYNFQNRSGLSDLYENASRSAAKIDELMDSVLGKE